MEVTRGHATSCTQRRLVGHQPSAHCRRRSPRQSVSTAVCCSTSQASSTAEGCSRRTAVSSAVLYGAIASLGMQTARPAHAAELQTSSSGLKYEDTKVGTGKEASKGTMIRCHYTGRLSSNGQVFDSSYERRRPLTFTIGVRQVIQGWDLGIVGTDDIPPMKEGGKRRLVIPPELGYGSRGAGGGKIPPNAELIFDVEYLGKK